MIQHSKPSGVFLASAAYANVHTTGHPSGEIRGALGHIDDDDD